MSESGGVGKRRKEAITGVHYYTGDKAGQIALWDAKTGKQLGKLLRGHKDFITALAWQPLHLSEEGKATRTTTREAIFTNVVFFSRLSLEAG